MAQSAAGVQQVEGERGRSHRGKGTVSFTPGDDVLGMGQRKQSGDRRKPLRGNDGCGGLQGGEKLERSDAGEVKIVPVADGGNTA